MTLSLPGTARAASLLCATALLLGTACTRRPTSPGPAPSASTTDGGRPAYKDPSLPIEQRVEDLIRRMSLQEKLVQLYILRGEDPLKMTADQIKRQFPHGVGFIGRPGLTRTPRETAAVVSAAQRAITSGTALGIPAFVVDEALHGYMAQGSTSFPSTLALASTWDPDLVRACFTVAAREMRARGSNWALTPVLDLGREPRWGRVEETYGEDPFLVSRMGVAAIQGLQGAPQGPDALIARDHVIATAKHFAVHGQPEAGTNSGPGNYSERIIREQFLPPFQAAVVEAGVWSVMASYNEIDGIPAHINRWLLGDVLRGEWGFRGFVTSDGGGIDELVKLHHVAKDRAEAARLALGAGIDFELGNTFQTLGAEVEAGRVALASIDTALRRVLRAKFRLGLFESSAADPEVADRLTNGPADQALAAEAARRAIVLLKNQDGLLPLDATKLRSVAVIGPNAAAVHLGGYSRDPMRGVSILDGIRNKLGDKVKVSHAVGCKITAGDATWKGWWDDRVEQPDRSDEPKTIAEAVRLARASDVAIVVVGENEATCREGWSTDHLGDRDDLGLLGGQSALVKAIAATGKPTIVFLINGRPLAIPDVVAAVPAVLEGWYLGQETGTAVADVLFGTVSPGGKLPITIPRSVGQLPVYYYQKPSGRRGYLWSDASPLFPFGHGLSYTTFSVSAPVLGPAKMSRTGKTTVTVEVTNTGARAGDEVVQLYIRDQLSSVTRPIKELKGFQRVGLKPGEKKSVRFTVGPEQLAFLDASMKRIVEPGLFDVMVGTSSVDVKTAVLEVTP